MTTSKKRTTKNGVLIVTVYKSIILQSYSADMSNESWS